MDKPVDEAIELRKEIDFPQTLAQYKVFLHEFDAAICEASAVGQAQANRMAPLHVGYATRIYARMCGHGISLIRAVPLSRWVHSNFQHWDFGASAPHARAIMEASLLFIYLMQDSVSDDEVQARINVMHLNDCTRRKDLFQDLGVPTDEAEQFEAQAEEIRERLRKNHYFTSLPTGTQKSCLNGKYLTILCRDDLIDAAGFKKGSFDAIYDLCSQHTHVLPLSFYRMEPNGRGTGLENDTDRGYIGMALSLCAHIFTFSTDRLVSVFPDVADVRRGVKSMFSPGPHENRFRPQSKKQKK